MALEEWNPRENNDPNTSGERKPKDNQKAPYWAKNKPFDELKAPNHNQVPEIKRLRKGIPVEEVQQELHLTAPNTRINRENSRLPAILDDKLAEEAKANREKIEAQTGLDPSSNHWHRHPQSRPHSRKTLFKTTYLYPKKALEDQMEQRYLALGPISRPSREELEQQVSYREIEQADELKKLFRKYGGFLDHPMNELVRLLYHDNLPMPEATRKLNFAEHEVQTAYRIACKNITFLNTALQQLEKAQSALGEGQEYQVLLQVRSAGYNPQILESALNLPLPTIMTIFNSAREKLRLECLNIQASTQSFSER